MPAANACILTCIDSEHAKNLRLLCAQFLAALSASALEHVAAVSGLHALAETVHLAALSLLRLISTNHVLHLPN